MKKTFGLFFFLFPIVFLAAAPLDKPAATVSLVKPEVITTKQLDMRYKEVENLRVQAGLPTPPQTRKQVLDSMIAEVLLKQAAERDRITVTDSELSNLVQDQKKNIEVQLRNSQQLADAAVLTDGQFRNIISQETGLSYDEFVDELRMQLMQQKYVSQTKRSLFESIEGPTPEQIEEQYNLYQVQFTNPKMVRFSQIFISTLNLSGGEKEKALARAEEAYKKLQQGESFESLVSQYTDDAKARYNGGDFGFLPMNDERSKAYFGNDFFNAVFNMEEGKISGVLTSNLGYHIVKITEKRERKFLGLDDPLAPGNPLTVREYIKRSLMQQIQQQILQKAYSELIDELKKEADITIFLSE